MVATYTQIKTVYRNVFNNKGYAGLLTALDNPLKEIFAQKHGINMTPIANLDPNWQAEFVKAKDNKDALINALKGLIAGNAQASDPKYFEIWLPGATAVTATCRPKYLSTVGKNMFEAGYKNVAAGGSAYGTIIPTHPVARALLLWDRKSQVEQMDTYKALKARSMNKKAPGFDDIDKADAEFALLVR